MKQKNCFKKFQDLYRSVSDKIKKGPDTYEVEALIEKLDIRQLSDPQFEYKVRNDFNEFYTYKLRAIHELEEYIIGFTWLKNPSVRTLDKIRYFITHNCSYKDTLVKFGGELSALQLCVYRASIKLDFAIGSETIDLLANSRTVKEVDRAMERFNVNIGYVKISKLILREAARELPIANRGIDITLQDCLRELKFIRKYAISSLKKVLGGINMSKLAFLIYILEGDDSSLKYEKVLCHKFINFDITEEEFEKGMSELQDEKLYNCAKN